VIDETFASRWIDRLRKDIPGTRAIILKGSHARGQAGPHSDIDFDVLTESGDESYRAYLEPDEAGRLIHVSVAVDSVEAWLADEDEPASWSFGLPAIEATKLLWAATGELRSRLDRPFHAHPAGDPELEDFVEGLGKVRNALREGNDLAVRLAAQNLARLCPTLLRLLNPDVRAETHLGALEAALAFQKAPTGYREDMLRCLGLSGKATTPDEILAAAERLVLGTLRLLGAHLSRHDPAQEGNPEFEFEIGLEPLLRNGTLERYLNQL